MSSQVETARDIYNSQKKKWQLHIDELLKQGQVNICPSCFKTGTRKRFCRNMVLLLPEKVLVCCCLGDKHEIAEKMFKKKVEAMKKMKF